MDRWSSLSCADRGRSEDVSRALISLLLSLCLHLLVLLQIYVFGSEKTERPWGARVRLLNVSIVEVGKVSANDEPHGVQSSSPTPLVVVPALANVDDAVLSSDGSSKARQDGGGQTLPERDTYQFSANRAPTHYFPTNSLEAKPELLHLPEPLLHRLAMEKHLDVQFFISPSGEVDRAELLSPTNGGGAQLVLESIQFAGRYFSPGRLAGEAVAVKMLIRFNASDEDIQSNLAGQAQGLLQDTNVQLRGGK